MIINLGHRHILTCPILNILMRSLRGAIVVARLVDVVICNRVPMDLRVQLLDVQKA